MHVIRSAIAAAGLLAAAAAAPAAAATLTHAYDFNAGTVTDTVGGVNGGVLGGASVTGGGALFVNGAPGSYAELTGKVVPTGGAAFSVALSAQAFSWGSGIVELISQGFSGGPGFYIGYAGSNFRLSDQLASTPVAFPTDGEWHDYLLTSSAAGTSFYIDGAPALAAAVQLAPTASGTNTRFGAQFAPYTENFHGLIDDVMVWDDALSTSEINALYGVSDVPVPAAAPLLAGAVALLVGLRRRRV
ncbi:LamG-like jellyroll fold domain-containing protein [Rhodovulum sp. DZ06]|uniref:LamG-like jellyroll fold domain-containing protein n=1 Tax=Rhodovulum sp. DZ06 TaxID=3425126 RepID=UPI003D34591B